MHSVILRIDLSMTDSYDLNKTKERLSNDLKRTSQTFSDIEKLGEGCWLISLSKSLPFLAKSIALAESCGIPYKVLYFEDEPVWISYQANKASD
jgi:hypothetical protein